MTSKSDAQEMLTKKFTNHLNAQTQGYTARMFWDEHKFELNRVSIGEFSGAYCILGQDINLQHNVAGNDRERPMQVTNNDRWKGINCRATIQQRVREWSKYPRQDGQPGINLSKLTGEQQNDLERDDSRRLDYEGPDYPWSEYHWQQMGQFSGKNIIIFHSERGAEHSPTAVHLAFLQEHNCELTLLNALEIYDRWHADQLATPSERVETIYLKMSGHFQFDYFMPTLVELTTAEGKFYQTNLSSKQNYFHDERYSPHDERPKSPGSLEDEKHSGTTPNRKKLIN